MAVTNFMNANIAVFKLTSGGAAYDIVLPFQADTIEWWNYTKWGTANVATTDENARGGIWLRGFPSGDGLADLTIVDNGTTALANHVLETSNCVTELSTGTGFADNHRTPTAITQASPAVVTSNGHGLSNGQFVRATDFRSTPVVDATGMYGLNNQLWQVGNVTANTFALFYPNTNLTIPFDSSAETAFVNNGIAQFTLVGPTLYTENPAPVFSYTLGSKIMGASNDVIYIRAMASNQYTNLGSV